MLADLLLSDRLCFIHMHNRGERIILAYLFSFLAHVIRRVCTNREDAKVFTRRSEMSRAKTISPSALKL